MLPLVLIVALSTAHAFAHPAVSRAKRNLDLIPEAQNNSAIIPLNQTELQSYLPYTLFAQASYCAVNQVKDWTCPGACEKLPEFKPTQVGGDGVEDSKHFIGFWPEEQAVVIVHEGSNIRSIASLLTDLRCTKSAMDPELFPGVSKDVRIHSGFAAAHAASARQVLAETKLLLDLHKVKNVVLVGHSLGGALAALDALSLTLNLPQNISIEAVTFGMPRIGNRAFVKLFDEKVPHFKRITNGKDPIPVLPPKFLGFVHSKGEIHLLGNGSAVACPGNDNAADARCTLPSVPSILSSLRHDHSGLYPGGLRMGKKYCGIPQPSWAAGIIGDVARKIKAGLDAVL